jgi:hypothetical protein
MHLALRQHQKPELTGGASETCVPEIERWLSADADHWRALCALMPPATLARYESVADFLVVAACPELALPCKRYYADKGPPLRDLRTAVELRVIAARTLVLCTVAYGRWCAKRRASWRNCCQLAHEVMEAA